MEDSENDGLLPESAGGTQLFDNPASSPTGLASSGQESSNRPRKRATLTPNTFRRFFTPRSASRALKNLTPSRQALLDITRRTENGNARRGTDGSSVLQPAPDLEGDTIDQENLSEESGGNKRRKTLHPLETGLLTPETGSSSATPLSSSQSHTSMDLTGRAANESTGAHETPEDEGHQGHDYMNEITRTTSSTAHGSRITDLHLGHDVQSNVSEEEAPNAFRPTRSVRRYHEYRNAGSLLQRELGLNKGRRFRYCPTSKIDTSRFFSSPRDAYLIEEEEENTIVPFCVAACNTNTLVAVGDEAGWVTVLESGQEVREDFSDVFLAFRPHGNAILDMTFSRDDMMLATASGDQSARIIDMCTQSETCRLTSHSSSVKQVRFQPGSAGDNIVATTSRDGDIKIWDLRCTPYRPVTGPFSAADANQGQVGHGNDHGGEQQLDGGIEIYQVPRANIRSAHVEPPLATSGPSVSRTTDRLHVPVPETRQAEVSVTALEFLPVGREHLFVTASDANACLKLWDMRAAYRARRGYATPLATTQQPETHRGYRSFGITSIALSGDSGRIYSLCRDNGIYVHSTSHLVLGHAPAFSQNTGGGADAEASGPVGQDGRGPIYSLRHPKLYASSFYVKMSVRRAQNDQVELLACGSNEGCAVIIPTDERQFPQPTVLSKDNPSQEYHTTLLPGAPWPQGAAAPDTPFWHPRNTATEENRALKGFMFEGGGSSPVYWNHGTPLIRGHSAEVSGVAWTTEGNLVTVGDDFKARCWREHRKQRLSVTILDRARGYDTVFVEDVLEASHLRHQDRELDHGATRGYGWADVPIDGDSDIDSDDDNDADDSDADLAPAFNPVGRRHLFGYPPYRPS